MSPSWRDFLHYFTITPSSTESLYLLFFIILFIALLFIFGQLLMSRRKQRERLAKGKRFFYTLAEARDLSADEVRLLDYLTDLYHPENPVFLINSVIEFDKAAGQFLKQYEPWYEGYDKEETSALLADIRRKCFHKEFHALDSIKDTREFPPGQMIRLTVQTESTKKFLNVAVAENQREGIVLESVDFSTYTEQLAEGSKITGYFWRTGDAGYQFDLTLLKLLSGDTILFSHSNRFERKQRRHYFRVSVKLKGTFYRYSTEEREAFYDTGIIDESVKDDVYSCVIVSLSGGGISLICKDSVENGDILNLQFRIKGGKQIIEVLSRVVRVKDLGRKNRVYVEFLNLSETSREAIIHFVSLVQLSDKKRIAK